MPRFISREEEAYTDLLLRDLDANSKKNGLQRLCANYRRGVVLPNPAPMRTFILGLLNDESEKVRRWALNALALLGTRREANPILKSVDDFRSSPDVLGAAISALSVLMEPEEFDKALLRSDLPLEGSILFAAAQQNDSFIPRLRGSRIEVDSASAVDLRMATILVGLNKAPFRLFSAKYSNASVIGQLNTHDDPLVAQYSVWAAVENPNLSLVHLALPLRGIEAQPENVRGWVFRLIASDPVTAAAHADIIQAGSRDGSVSARNGLAEGLLRTAFPGIDDIILEWSLREPNDGVRQQLLEHMARFGDQFPRYVDMVTGVYGAAAHNSLPRARLEAAARGTTLYSTLKVIDLNAGRADLFAGTSAGQTAPKSAEAIPMKDPAPLPEANDVRVLVVVALPKEMAAVLATMSRYRFIGKDGDPNVYAIGEFVDPAGLSFPRTVLVCRSGMGNNNAATTATNAMRSFRQIEYLIMCGIAGGCPNPERSEEHVRLGDIVYSNALGIIEYDFVKEDREGTTIRSSAQKPSNRMLGVIEAMMAEEILDRRPWEPEIDAIVAIQADFNRPSDDQDVLHDRNGGKIEHPAGTDRRGRPRIHGGAIGSADTLQKNPEMRDDLRDRYRVRAIEMEAGGMQNAAWARDLNVMVVRGICDYCDANKCDAWQMYAAAAAAAFTKVLALGMPIEWFPAS